MKQGFWKTNIDIVLLVAFVAVIAFAFASDSEIGYWVAAVFAVVGFIVVQQPENRGEPDERDVFISHRSSTYGFSVTLTVVVFASVLSDFIPAVEALSTAVLLNTIIAMMFVSYTVSYAVMKRRN